MIAATGRQHSGHPPAGQAASVSEVPVLATPARRIPPAVEWLIKHIVEDQSCCPPGYVCEYGPKPCAECWRKAYLKKEEEIS